MENLQPFDENVIQVLTAVNNYAMDIHTYVYFLGNTYKVKFWICICWNLVGNFEYSSKVDIWIFTSINNSPLPSWYSSSGAGERQGSLECCSPCGHKESTQLSNWITRSLY